MSLAGQRELTDSQEKEYFKYLSAQKQSQRCLAFLVPRNWDNNKYLETLLKNARASFPSIGTTVTFWDQVLEIIEKTELHKLNVVFDEAHKQFELMFRPPPVKLSLEEVNMLFKKELPKALTKLDFILRGFQERAENSFAYELSRQRRFWPEDEYGLYLKNDAGKQVLWFGVWVPFWAENGFPLCFGVNNQWAPSLRQAFAKAYKGETYQFRNWTVGAISQEMLMSDAPVETIWKQMGPIIEVATRISLR